MSNKETLQTISDISNISTNLLNTNTFLLDSTLTLTKLRNRIYKAFNTYNLEVLPCKRVGVFYVVIY